MTTPRFIRRSDVTALNRHAGSCSAAARSAVLETVRFWLLIAA